MAILHHCDCLSYKFEFRHVDLPFCAGATRWADTWRNGQRIICKLFAEQHARNSEENGTHENVTVNTTTQLEITASRQFTNWMREQKLSLGFTAYQAGKLFLLD